MNRINRFLAPFAFGVALATLGVVGAATLTSCAATSQTRAHVVAVQSLYLAELAYRGFATSIVDANHAGLLKGERLTQAKAAEQKAYDALLAARAGRASADAVIDSLTAAAGLVPLVATPPT